MTKGTVLLSHFCDVTREWFYCHIFGGVQMNRRILCFGDSNTFGTIPGTQRRHDDAVRWSGILQSELGEGYTVITEGYGGRTTVFSDPVENKMSGIDYFYPCTASQMPLDLVIIMLGTNDLKPRFGVNAASIAFGLKRYADTLKLVKEEYPRPGLLIVSPVLIDPAYKNDPDMHAIFGEDADVRSREFAEAFSRTAEVLGAHFLNAADFARASKTDGIHLEAEEHRKLGTAIAVKVKEILEGIS